MELIRSTTANWGHFDMDLYHKNEVLMLTPHHPFLYPKASKIIFPHKYINPGLN